MRLVALVALLALVGCTAEALEPRAAPASAVTAPDFELRLLDGSTVTASRIWADRPTVLVFLASWCTTCADRERALAKLVGDYQHGVAFLGIAAADDAGALRTYVDEHGVEYEVGLDDDQTVWRKYAVREPPAVVLVAKGGKVVKGWPGGLEPSRLDAEIRRWLVATR
jgi:peroxiredoxin